MYSVDSSALIHAWAEAYPIDIFGPLWDFFSERATAGVLVASREVLLEIEVKDDGLSKWAKGVDMFREIDDPVQDKVAELMAKYPKLVDERTSKSAGDPWVIGLASAHGLCVVTQEKGGTLTKPKIPSVCSAERIRCINTLTLIRELGWRM